MGNPSDVFQRKVINPSPRNTAQWAGVPAAIRVSSFFSATVENVALLNRMHSLIDDYLHEAKDIVIINGTPTTVCRVAGKSDFIKQMRDFMQKEGMPIDATDNNITNLASHRRLALVFDTNIRSAYGQARWETAMTTPMRKAFPAWRFVRHPGAKKPRPLHKLNEGTVRLKDDFQFWAIEMNSRHIGGFELPWPPFGFNSWMDLESVPAKECQKLGLIPPNYTPPPLDTSAFGASPAERVLQKATSTKSIKNPKLAALLKKKLAQNLGHPLIEQGTTLSLPAKQLIKIISPPAKKPLKDTINKVKNQPPPSSIPPHSKKDDSLSPDQLAKLIDEVKSLPNEEPPQIHKNISPEGFDFGKYRVLSAKEADDLHREICGKMWRNSSKEEKKALHSYTSSFHAPINTGIGGAKGNLNKIDDKYKHTVQTITIMDEKMKQCPVASDIIVFRGESIKVFGLILGLKKKEQDEIRHALGRGFPQDFINKMNTNYSGKIITRHSFTSCGIAEGKGFTANSHPIQLRIAVPKGTLGIYAEPFSAYGLGDKLDWDGYSKQKDFSQEDEIILNRGLKMHIIKFATNGIALYVHAEIIP